jgi:hypothetical protein
MFLSRAETCASAASCSPLQHHLDFTGGVFIEHIRIVMLRIISAPGI